LIQLLKLSAKKIARQEQFRKVGRALADYYTGNPSEFRIHPRKIQDPKLSSSLGGPAMCSQQWERTSKP
jgi:hypothetical protein